MRWDCTALEAIRAVMTLMARRLEGVGVRRTVVWWRGGRWTEWAISVGWCRIMRVMILRREDIEPAMFSVYGRTT